MSNKKQVEAFFNKVKKDEELKAKLKKAEKEVNQELNKEDAEAFFNEKLRPLAEEYGFSFSYEDLIEYKKELTPEDCEELDDELLAKVWLCPKKAYIQIQAH